MLVQPQERGEDETRANSEEGNVRDVEEELFGEDNGEELLEQTSTSIPRKVNICSNIRL